MNAMPHMEEICKRVVAAYEDFYIASREQAETQYQHAVEFVEAVKNYLEGENVCKDNSDNELPAAEN